MKRVLVTGVGGLIGGVVRRHLEGRYELSGLDRNSVPGLPCVRADIADPEKSLPAYEGKDVVVHLAGIARLDASWADTLQQNVIGTYQVFESARRAGVKRIIYASSGNAIAGWEREMPYRALVDGRYDEVPEHWQKLTHLAPLRPSGLYGCSKVWGESLARHFTDTSDLSILCLRIGSVNPENRPLKPRHFSVWCSHGDLARIIERCIEAPSGIKFDIFYAQSNNRWSYRDSEHAREVIGFEPRDAAEEYRQADELP
jgi:nucleoside-diphosphate-sugar epimerase